VFPLDAIVTGTDTRRLAGRLAVDVVFMLVKPGDPGPDPGLPSNRVVVARVQGRFLSTDAVALFAIEDRRDEWGLSVAITRSENPNLEPAPRDLFVVIAFGAATPPARVALRFSGRLRAFDDSERPLDDLPPQPQVITIA
jgi:hypothetical protein